MWKLKEVENANSPWLVFFRSYREAHPSPNSRWSPSQGPSSPGWVTPWNPWAFPMHNWHYAIFILLHQPTLLPTKKADAIEFWIRSQSSIPCCGHTKIYSCSRSPACLGNQLIYKFLETRNLVTKGISLTHREELVEELIGTLFPSVHGFTVGVELLLHFSQQRERE